MRRTRGWVGAGLLALILLSAASASAAPTFSAHGSVEQVYVTGLAANQRMALLDTCRT